MRNWKAFVLAGLVSLVLVSAVFAVISPPVAPVAPAVERTSINVVCLYKDFPTIARITVSEIDAEGNSIPRTGVTKDTPNGFASFRVKKNRSYRVTADKIEYIGEPGVVVASRALEISSPPEDIVNISSAAVVGLIITSIR